MAILTQQNHVNIRELNTKSLPWGNQQPSCVYNHAKLYFEWNIPSNEERHNDFLNNTSSPTEELKCRFQDIA